MKEILLSPIGMIQALKVTGLLFTIITIILCAITVIKTTPVSVLLIKPYITFIIMP